MRRLAFLVLCVPLFTPALPENQPNLVLNEQGHFSMPGLDVMVFAGNAREIYPEGHQGGVIIVQNGERVASNGDLRLEPTPGQWQPIPKLDGKTADQEKGEVVVRLSYPDPARNRKGFNPIEYPDLSLSYQVRVRPEGQKFRILVDLDQPLPEAWIGKVGFNLELYPAALFGKTWQLDDKYGVFPRQANGPVVKDAGGDLQPKPFATGKRLVVAPELDAQRMVIESRAGDLQLYDGRNNHNNGWFVVRSLVPSGATREAIDWLVAPYAISGWMYKPVVHVSQVGYHPNQSKVAVIETDSADQSVKLAVVKRIGADGQLAEAFSGTPTVWGRYLRYRYLTLDFTGVNQPGMYLIDYGDSRTAPFKIDRDVYQRDVWQPTLEYFLPAQMCHMRVNEKYRVWHGLCHMDDALMAPINHNHIDGYSQGASTLTVYQPGDPAPGLNVGGWHDAGDWDLRVESQADEVLILVRAYEAFDLKYDNTTVDQKNHVVEINQPDGKPDALQQIEHGALTLLASYKNLGRLYRGIIEPTLRQYVLIGDGANITDNLVYDARLAPDERTATHSGVADDRWVFTEQNAMHEYKGIAALAAAGRALKGYDDEFAAQCLAAAEDLWKQQRAAGGRGAGSQVEAAVELLLTTRNPIYSRFILDNRAAITSNIRPAGWILGQALPLINDPSFTNEVRAAVITLAAETKKQKEENPFGVPYRPAIWGAGWIIQKFGVDQYFLHKAFPDLVPADGALNALEFVLGRHPGSNTASFASGVGARSAIPAYGFNRADWSYIPGGVVSGTALIRPDFPELKEFPYLWQQTEYVLGGGATNFMFLVLAADQLLNGEKR